MSLKIGSFVYIDSVWYEVTDICVMDQTIMVECVDIVFSDCYHRARWNCKYAPWSIIDKLVNVGDC